jgi:hypothetical protein
MKIPFLRMPVAHILATQSVGGIITAIVTPRIEEGVNVATESQRPSVSLAAKSR